MTCHNIFNNKKDFVSASCFVRKYAYCSFKLRRGDTLLAITPKSLKKDSHKDHLSYSIHKQDAIDIADPSSMQDPCHMNFVIDP